MKSRMGWLGILLCTAIVTTGCASVGDPGDPGGANRPIACPTTQAAMEQLQRINPARAQECRQAAARTP